jgi:hypothetical protein
MLAGFWLLGALLAGLLLTADALRPGGRGIVKISGVDAAAYFAVAHSLLMDRDLDLTNQYQAIAHQISPWLAVQPVTGRPGSPFPIGYSLLTLPFLALGHGLDLALGHAGDGRSGLALTCYHLANPVFLGLGLGFLFLFLRGLATAAIDVSDGLLADLGHICERSGVAATIEFERLPASPLLRRHLQRPAARAALLAGGDDYELCFTAPATARDTLAALAEQLQVTLTRIGQIRAGHGCVVRDAAGQEMEIGKAGYDHFA